jgi:predicted TIM-barrel fold metal-dependent hydrolase
MIIDAQIHAWEETSHYPTPASARSNHGSEFTIEQSLAVMDAAGVDAAILVPPGTWDTGPTKNSYSLSAAMKHPQRFAVMGQFDFDAADREHRLATWRQEPGMLGIRKYVRDHSFLVESSMDWFWKGLVTHDIPFMSSAPVALHLFEDLLGRFPDLRLILDHAGREPYTKMDEAAWLDLDIVLRLAKRPKVSVKVSSLPAFSSRPYPFPSLHEPLRRIFDAFGPRRMLWGSDVTRLRWSYEDNLRLFTEGLGFLSPEDKEWILGRSAAMQCRWDSMLAPVRGD